MDSEDDHRALDSGDSAYDSEDGVLVQVRLALRRNKRLKTRHREILEVLDPQRKVKRQQRAAFLAAGAAATAGSVTGTTAGGTQFTVPNPGGTDMPTLRNVQTLVAVCLEQGYVNSNGSPLPLSADSLTKYIEFQAARMEAGQLSLSSLNWYLQSLRRYCLDSGLEWEGIRQTENVKTAMGRARRIAAVAKLQKEVAKTMAMSGNQSSESAAVLKKGLTDDKSPEAGQEAQGQEMDDDGEEDDDELASDL